MTGRSLRWVVFAWLGLSVAALAQVNPQLYAGVQWRNIGPWHGGRIASVAGVIQQPGVYYAGLPQGGIWKTTSAGVTWFPIFDQVRSVEGIGALAVAPSDPNIVYAGTGDATAGGNGDGIWKSTDAGKTWSHIGLEDTVKIDKIFVDPQDANLVLASTLGDEAHHGGGIYRSTDGGQTWSNVLNPAGYGGTRDLEGAYDVPKVMFAATMGQGAARFGPPTPGAKTLPAEVFKSTDEGLTWTQLTGVPVMNDRIVISVAQNTNAQRLYILGGRYQGGSGLIRSDDGGASWRHMAASDTRIVGSGYTAGVFTDTKNPDVVYTNSTAVYRSSDGGNSFTVFKGAPGGEDYHRMWIDPLDHNRMMIGADQGATVSLDGGKTWSLWYHEPFAQLYHVNTTNSYPYWVVGSQQDTGAVMTRDRSDWGEINVTDWSPFPSSEFGPITPDPVHPKIFYGVGYGPGGGSGLIKINMATRQWESINPNFGVRAADYRTAGDVWKKFDTRFDPSALYVAYQCLLVTHNGGQSWSDASPDLTTAKGAPRVACGTPPPPSAAPPSRFNRGSAIVDFSISKAQKGVIWTVSTNGQIYNTVDGGKVWTNVSNVPDVPANFAFNTIAAGLTPGSAYVSGRLGGRRSTVYQTATEDGNTPWIWRTGDGGRSWTKIVAGLPSDQRSGSWVNVVLPDPQQPGLLFCGTESAVYASFDDGGHWQSLQRNMPTISIQDMVFHTYNHMSDLVIATYGRGFWIMDDTTPLRALAAHAATIAAASPAYLFQPGDAIRARKNVNWDQPFNPEEPHSANPPYGALIYYYLSQPPSGTITLDVYDAHGSLVHSESSVAPPPVADAHYPDYWLSPPQDRSLASTAGMHRVNWDLLYNDPPAFQTDLENQMNMVEGSVTAGPHGPQVIPGEYTLKLTVDGHVYSRTLTVINDPRVGQGPQVMADLQKQNELNMDAYHAMQGAYAGHAAVAEAQTQVSALGQANPPAEVASQAKVIEAKLAAIGGRSPAAGGGFRRGGPAPKPGQLESFVEENNAFNALVSIVQVGMDMAPTPAQIATWENDCRHYNQTATAWNQMKTHTLVAFNQLLNQNHLQPIAVSSKPMEDPSCSVK
ncbi:MAG: WD40/YVTN/BNR-like repeat-containing protein [Terriglobales bacterium]